MKHLLIGLFALGASACCGEHHLRMNAPATSPGSEYTCESIPRGGEGTVRCEPAKTSVPADENKSGTIFFNLPAQCEGRVNQIIVYNADQKDAHLAVKCAPNPPPNCPMPP